jgi:hypothetical protein
MLKYGKIIFDDWTPASETSGDSAWAYVCEKHLDDCLVKCPDVYYDGASVSNAICGVLECNQGAYYEIDLIEEDEITLINEI